MKVPARRLWLGDAACGRRQISMTYGIDDLRFETSYWYDDVDLHALRARFGAAFMERLLFHILAFEANKLVSLAPATIDLGPFAHLHTRRFERLWTTVARRVWAQWRYEHDLPGYRGPAFPQAPRAEGYPDVAEPAPGPAEILCFCGGGKDSLVAMKLLERAGLPFATHVYAHSIYGPAQPQHDLVGRLLRHAAPVVRHRHWIFDSFVDAPVAELAPAYGIRSTLAAETPSSVFGALPVALQHGYRFIVTAHERSANTGNLVWETTGEEVNHQWGKSLEAEAMLGDYVRTELAGGVDYFSLLQPLYDAAIFHLLRQDLDAVPDTHSCNVRKPWCGRCAKCAYVWLGYMAYLPVDLVRSFFPENLFDLEENLLWFRQMLGLEDHTPFECIGQVDEARLAFELCRRKGLDGRAMRVFVRDVPPVDVPGSLARFLEVDFERSRIPPHILDRVRPLMAPAADPLPRGTGEAAGNRRRGRGDSP